MSLHAAQLFALWNAAAAGTPAGGWTLRRHDAGSLLLPTGRIVACDPSVISGEEEAFVRTVPPGSYPVALVIASDAAPARVAAAIIRFGDAAPVSWERARTAEDEDLAMTGYGVDSATGCFLDSSALAIVSTDLEPSGEWERLIDEALEASPDDDWFSADIPVSQSPPTNAIVFSSGLGDGLYASWFGLDAAGNAACLLTDFEVVDLEAKLPTPDEKPAGGWKFWKK
jgi:hypothetical protein